MNCSICWKETNQQVTVDIDVQSIPICDDTTCYIKLQILLDENLP